ncbi:MAG: hypothetical protein HFI94_08605 [Lachnospiraceae bacterium]|jgi:hypothetical protein|nr:hypothetical protein [Lachnospiraceae bacterium]
MKKITNIIVVILLVFVPAFLCAGAGYIYQKPVNEQIRNLVMLSVGTICLAFAWFYFEHSGLLDYDNENHEFRFVVFFLGGLLFSCLLPLFPFQLWPIVAIGVALSFFSNTFLGLYSYTLVVMFSSYLAGAPANIFFLYFLGGSVAILLFSQMNDAYKVGIPIVISLLFLLVAETAATVLFINERLTWELFLIPLMNLCLTGLLLLCILKYFSFSVVHKYQGRYQDIYDSEFELLVKIKQEANEDYRLALHTAHFSERIASSIQANAALAKAGAYYHRIGKIYREKWGDTADEEEIIRRVCEEYRFPPNVREVLLECARREFVSRESTIVMFSDAIISAVLFLFSKEPSGKPDYEQVVGLVFEKKQAIGALNDSRITLHELSVMKQIFIREKLYYDLLR